MPGRVFLTTPPDVLARQLGCSADPVADELPRQNIAPGQDVVTLTSEGFRRMRWGLIPVGRVNARGRPVMETIIDLFRNREISAIPASPKQWSLPEWPY